MFEEYTVPLLPKRRQTRNIVLLVLLTIFVVGVFIALHSVIIAGRYHHIPHFLALVVCVYAFYYAISSLQQNPNPRISKVTLILIIIGLLLVTTAVWTNFFSPLPDDVDACDSIHKKRGGLFATKDGACFPRCKSSEVEILVVHNDDPLLSRCLPIRCSSKCYKP
ncbi:hypothetical protein GEMRC1_011512 [Eukaryota sp. GEM-RC1]